MREADELFANQSYAAALPAYLEAIEKEPESAMLNYKIGVSYLYSRSLKQKAVPYLEKAVLNSTSYLTKSYNSDKDAPLNVYKHLGDAYFLVYDFNSAIKTFEKYKELLKENKEPDQHELASVDAKLDMCRLVKDLKPQMSLPISASTGKPCNGDLVSGEFTSALSPDKTAMIYTVKVPVNKLSGNEGSQYFEPLPTRWQDSLQKLANTIKAAQKPSKKNLELDTVVYATTIGTSYDGQVVLTYKNDEGVGNLYILRLKENKWTAPVKVAKGGNVRGWEPQENISADGSTMYFVSDRPGGFGGKDIYKCTRLPNGEWSKAVNLGPQVNSAADEVAPFIHPEGGILYFSSNRIKPGSYDIYAANQKNNDWERPVNVGYPINRHDQDIFQVTADNRKVFPAGKPAAAKLNNKDSTFTPLDPDKENVLISFVSQQKIPLTVYKGQVTDKNSNTALGAKVSLVDNLSGVKLGQYYAENGSGLYSIVLPFSKNLGIVYERDGYLFRTENIEVSKDNNYFQKHAEVSLAKLEENASTTLSCIYFEGNATSPAPVSKNDLDLLYHFLEKNPDASIEIVSHSASSGGKGFQKRLAKKRAAAIAADMARRKISKERLSASGEYHKSKEIADKKKKSKDKTKKKKVAANSEAAPKTQWVEIRVKKLRQ